MSLPTISPDQAKRLLDEGADAGRHPRGGRARARKHRGCPANCRCRSSMRQIWLCMRASRSLFHCKSGARTLANAPRLADKAGDACEAYIVEGGLDAWKRAGLPVVTDRRQPIELQRQVQIGAGSLVFFGTLLGLLASPWFFAVPLFVGGGLMNAGMTGFCGMARLLVHMPWNRASYRPKAAHA